MKGGTFLLLGQTDAGKSTFAGHLLYKCGFFEERDIGTKGDRYSKLIDETNGDLLQNKSRTTDYLCRDFTYQNKTYTLIDTPGHKIYIRSLIDGLYSMEIDLIVLVISSLKDEYLLSVNRGTVKEDLLLARSVGCPNLLVVWNKHDIGTVTEEEKELLHSYIKLLRFKKVDQVCVSALSGEGIFKIFDYIKPEAKVLVEEKSSIVNKLEAIVSFHSTDIITAGYTLVMHHKTGELDVEILEIRRNGCLIRYVKDKEPYSVVFKCSGVEKCKGDRIILRSFTETIGYGRLL